MYISIREIQIIFLSSLSFLPGSEGEIENLLTPEIN